MKFGQFLESDSGAVTTDYVFWITASVWSTMSIVAVPTDGVETVADRIAADLGSGTIVFQSFEELAAEGRVLTSALADPSGEEAGEPASAPTGGEDQDGVGDHGGPQGNNGWGNGNQAAPGNSGPNNNAENGGGAPPPGLSGNGNGNGNGNNR